MSAGDVRTQPSLLSALVDELERGGAGRLAEIARRLGPDWTKDDVRVELATPLSHRVAGHDHEIEFWWVA